MARPSVLATQINGFLVAKSWSSSADRFTIRCSEPALEPVNHTWMAGEAPSMTDGEVKQTRPSRIIVPDNARSAEIARLKQVMESQGIQPRVETLTRFIDFLWDAPLAARRARDDAELQDTLLGESEETASVDARHTPQRVELAGVEIPDHYLLEKGMSADSSWLALLADAGLGKSELLQWHEWRCAVRYDTAYSEGRSSLPAIALRIPLRGLRSLSLDGIAHFLSHPNSEGNLPPLRRIDTGACLRELLQLQRIILLLDGVDELMLSRDQISQGLRELRRAVLDGGRVVLSAREGHLKSIQSINADFKQYEIARIMPMDAEKAKKLLRNYGASATKADVIYGHLAPTAAHGIPLFLLMAYRVDLSAPLRTTVSGSRTRILLDLLRLFCERDESRLGVTTDEQMRILTQFAHWTGLFGAFTETTALETLGLDPSDHAAAVFQNPHALLTRAPGDVIEFKYPQFGSLFSAKALAEDWTHLGFESTLDDLKSRKLDQQTVEFLARLVPEEKIQMAWAFSRDNERVRRSPLVRRNLLALALACVDDDEIYSREPRTRSSRLAGLLGEKVIEDVSLADVSLVRFDFDGWTLRRLQGYGGSMLYCTNLAQCTYDDSIQTIDGMEGTSLPAQVDTAAVINAGVERLRKLIKPLRRPAALAMVRMLNQSRCRDKKGWAELRRRKLAELTHIGTAGSEKTWVLTDDGTSMLSSFMAADNASQDQVRELYDKEADLKDLLLGLGSLTE